MHPNPQDYLSSHLSSINDGNQMLMTMNCIYYVLVESIVKVVRLTKCPLVRAVDLIEG